jgi:hypothetical protein
VKVVLLFTLLTAIGIGGFFLVSEDKRWLFFNGNDAEVYATQLLSGGTAKTPDRFIDYSVSTNNGYVVFSKHGDHSTIYGYFPVKTPTEIGGAALKVNWEKLDGKWFVSHP